jgi:hypothetical protein
MTTRKTGAAKVPRSREAEERRKKYDEMMKKQVFGLRIGEAVMLEGDHLYSGHMGEVIGFNRAEKPRVQLFDMNSHEVVVDSEDQVRSLMQLRKTK